MLKKIDKNMGHTHSTHTAQTQYTQILSQYMSHTPARVLDHTSVETVDFQIREVCEEIDDLKSDWHRYWRNRLVLQMLMNRGWDGAATVFAAANPDLRFAFAI